MKLMKPDLWVQKYFDEDSRPPELTLQRLLRTGKIPGRKVGGTWYIDEHAWLADGNERVLAELDEAG